MAATTWWEDTSLGGDPGSQQCSFPTPSQKTLSPAFPPTPSPPVIDLRESTPWGSSRLYSFDVRFQSIPKQSFPTSTVSLCVVFHKYTKYVSFYAV